MTPAFRLPAGCVLVLLALAGCDRFNTAPVSQATPAQVAACRQRADEVWLRQNRQAIFESDVRAGGQRDAPFAGAGITGNTSAGLSSRFSREQMVNNCLTSGSANTVRPAPGAATPPTPPRPTNEPPDADAP